MTVVASPTASSMRSSSGSAALAPGSFSAGDRCFMAFSPLALQITVTIPDGPTVCETAAGGQPLRTRAAGPGGAVDAALPVLARGRTKPAARPGTLGPFAPRVVALRQVE